MLVCSKQRCSLTATLTLGQGVHPGFCSDRMAVRVLHTGTQRAHHLLEQVKFYIALDCPQTLWAGRGPGRARVGRLGILVNC